MNTNVPSEVPVRSLTAFINYVERMAEEFPLPWTPAPFGVQYGLFRGKRLLVISETYESARATAKWLNEVFAE